MAIFRADTLETLRLDIGRSAGIVETHTTTSTGDTTSIISTTLRGGSNAHRGKWARIVSGAATVAPEGEVKQVTAFDGTSDLTTDAFSGTIANSVDFELWDSDMSPAIVDRMINRAINMAFSGHKSMVDLIEDTAASIKVARYAMPTNMVGVEKIEYRTSVASVPIHTTGVAFDKTVSGNITASSDTKDLRWGSASSKFVVAAGASSGNTASDDVENSSLDLSGMDTIEFWLKDEHAGTPAASDWKLALNAGGVQKAEITTAVQTDQTWQYQRIAIDDPQDCTAIDEIELVYNTDVGAATAWLNYVWAVRDDSGTWETLHRKLWYIDEASNEIIFRPPGRDLVGNHVIRISGAQIPRALTADTDVTQVDPEYIIDMALGMVFAQTASRSGDRSDANFQLAGYHRGLGEAKLARTGSGKDIRWAS